MENEKKEAVTTHDKLFRGSLEQLPIARDFFEAHLSKHVLARVKLDTLKLEPGSFIDEAHKELRTDILYSVQIDEREGYIFLSVEHQSTPDKLMGFRLLNYACRVWQRYIDQYEGKSLPDKLPVVLPLVIYSGKVAYNQSTKLLDCFTDPELLQEFLFDQFKLIDLTALPNGEIEKHKRAAFMEWLGKNIWVRDMGIALQSMNPDIVRVIKDLNNGKYLIFALKYLAEKSEAQDSERTIEILKEKLPEMESDIMTIAQALEQKGAHQKQMEIARQMLRDGVSSEKISLYTGISKRELTTLN